MILNYEKIKKRKKPQASGLKLQAPSATIHESWTGGRGLKAQATSLTSLKHRII
jgi:hypothetical protein